MVGHGDPEDLLELKWFFDSVSKTSLILLKEYIY